MPQLSVIVPVYKAEPYIEKCIASIINQSVNDLELILIDDGSPDLSGKICDSYAEKDSRISVIHQQNHGVSHARNTGIALAKGQYVAFVDADDWIELNMYEKLLEETKKNQNLDIVACNRYLDEDTIHNYHPYTQYDTKEKILLDLFSKPSFMMGGCCNKIFRAEIVKKHRFYEEIKIWEDLIFLTELYLSDCSNAVFIPDYLYHYRTNENSATHNSLPRYEKDNFRKYIFKPMKAYSHLLAAASLDYFLDSSLQILSTLRKIDNSQKRELILSVRKTILYWTIYGRITSLLNRHQFNRYFVEGVLH